MGRVMSCQCSVPSFNLYTMHIGHDLAIIRGPQTWHSFTKLFIFHVELVKCRENPFITNFWDIHSTDTQYVHTPRAHDDVIKWKHFPRYWPLCGEFTGDSPHKGQSCGALMFSLICALINGWVNKRAAGELRHHRAHYDIIVMPCCSCCG